MKHLLLLLLLAASTGLFAQYDAEKIEYLDNYDNDNLPTHTFGTFNEVWGYAIGGREYAIFGSAGFIHIYEVTDPRNIVEVITINPQSQTVWRDFKTYGHYLYAVADQSPDGLMVFDLANIFDNQVPMVAQIKDQFSSCHNIFIDEANGRLYTAGAGSGGSYVYDLYDDPANPAYLGNISVGSLHDIYVKDNVAYCSAGFSGYFIYDVSDVTNIKLMASAETQGYNHSSWVSEDGTYALFAEEVPTGLPMGIMDLCDLENGNIEVNNYFAFPLIINTAGPSSTPHNPFIIGNYAYVSYYHDGLLVFDISNPKDVKRVGHFDTFHTNTDYDSSPKYQGAWGCYPFLPSGNILLCDMEFGLFTLDFELDDQMSPPSTPICPGVSSDEDLTAYKDLALFPNPSQGLIQFELPATVVEYDLQLISTAGQVVLQNNAVRSAQVEQLDLSNLAKGLYFLEIKSEKASFLQKLVIE